MITKTIKYFIATALCALIFVSCGGTHVNNVVMVEKMKSFHREGCPKITMAKSETVLVQMAIEKGCKPCPECKPEIQQ